MLTTDSNLGQPAVNITEMNQELIENPPGENGMSLRIISNLVLIWNYILCVDTFIKNIFKRSFSPKPSNVFFLKFNEVQIIGNVFKKNYDTRPPGGSAWILSVAMWVR